MPLRHMDISDKRADVYLKLKREPIGDWANTALTHLHTVNSFEGKLQQNGLMGACEQVSFDLQL